MLAVRRREVLKHPAYQQTREKAFREALHGPLHGRYVETRKRVDYSCRAGERGGARADVLR